VKVKTDVTILSQPQIM